MAKKAQAECIGTISNDNVTEEEGGSRTITCNDGKTKIVLERILPKVSATIEFNISKVSTVAIEFNISVSSRVSPSGKPH
jgi:hypothetical protein